MAIASMLVMFRYPVSYSGLVRHPLWPTSWKAHIHRRLECPSLESEIGVNPPDSNTLDDVQLTAWIVGPNEADHVGPLEEYSAAGIEGFESIEDLIEKVAKAVDAARAFKIWIATMMLPEGLVAASYGQVVPQGSVLARPTTAKLGRSAAIGDILGVSHITLQEWLGTLSLRPIL